MPSSASTSLRRQALRTLLGCSAIVVVCAMPVFAQARHPSDAAKPFATFSASAQSLRDSLVALARAQVGTKYVSGGTSPDRGFDCSGLVRYVMSALELKLPRTAKQQATSGLPVARDANHLLPGDLLTFGKSKRGVSHVGIYVGNGRYVHASTSTGRVIESDITDSRSSLVRAWRGVRRIVVGVESDSTKRPKGDG